MGVFGVCACGVRADSEGGRPFYVDSTGTKKSMAQNPSAVSQPASLNLHKQN